MRKRVVVSMLVIALAAALLGGAAFAWFTDSDSAEAKFTAGTLVLGDIPDFTGDLNIEAPGDTDDWTVTISNDGTLDMYYRLYFTSVITKEGAEPLQEVVNVRIFDSTDQELKSGKIDTISASNPWFEESMQLGTTTDDKEITYKIHFELPTDTGNEYQGATWTITLHVDATQVKNNTDPSWTE